MDLIDTDLMSLVERVYNCKFDNFLYMGLDSNFINDINILEGFHNIYLEIGDKLDSDLSLKLKRISDKYLFLVNKREEYINNYNFNECGIVLKHNPYDVSFEEIDFIKEYSDCFSLDKLFGFNDDERIGGVIVITPIQTVCMMNDKKFGYVGSGYHKDSFSKIVKAVYEDSFVDDGIDYIDSWQDIIISISNSIITTRDGDIQRIIVDVEVPTPISVSQKSSLERFNEELKGYEDIVIEVNSSLVNHFNEEFFLEFEKRDNLDDLLYWVISLDSYDFEYKDKNIIGVLNENTKIKQ